ncbi:DMT family transporter [Streptomyces olivaceus]|uniref:DMT family transporter n=1 Tax=Streptomyces olivaceus TaxID=47716 RepID=UPI001CCA6BB3|nr:DMT family transporter [Streptomyces olivaceus]MBZ6136469.1 DMT family transporter [Streptomyces olivaceus]MBZ6163533.1 DMT family transporter [Streptomyces olivaceus]
MSALALSVLLSLVSAVAYAGGAIVQEQVAVSSPVAQYAPLRRPAWWAAVALNGLGGLLHVVALALGPLSLVQPLGALTIVFALPMAALFVGRRAGATAWRGALMATVGLAGLLSLVGASDAQSLNTAQRVGAALVTGGVVVALMIAGRAVHRHPAVRSILLATASGIAFGMSSVFTKTVAVDWTGGVSATDLPSLAVIGVLATAGMVLSQASYRGAGLAAPLATLTVVNPVVAAVVGITMFGETFRYGTTGTALALSCGVVAAGGLILLTTERIARESAGEAASDATPADGAPAGPAPVKEAPTGGAPVAVAAAAARVEAERAALVSAAAESGTVPGVAGIGTVPGVAGSGTVQAPAAQARPRKRAADEERERHDEQSARLSGKVLVPASAADAPAAEETFDALVPAPGPAEGDYPPPSFGPFYGGPFVPPPAFGRRGVRIRS